MFFQDEMFSIIFNGKHYQQTQGCIMGSKCSPLYLMENIINKHRAALWDRNVLFMYIYIYKKYTSQIYYPPIRKFRTPLMKSQSLHMKEIKTYEN